MNTRSIIFFVICAISLASCLDAPEDPNKQHNQEITQIDQYLSSFGTTDVIYQNSTGIRMLFHNYGNDAPPRDGQIVKLNYIGKIFPDGTIFDSGEINEDLKNIVPEGLNSSVSIMLKGSSATVFIPSKFAFGKQGTTNVPPNSIVEYELYLNDVTRTSAQQHQFTTDTAAIHDYIKGKAIENAIQHNSGIWYTIDEPGAGQSPKPYSSATFAYKLKLMTNDGVILEQNTLTNFLIFGLIDGLKVGLPLIGTGTTATFYIPSGLGYGSSAQGNIPANSNLIFEIKLNSIN